MGLTKIGEARAIRSLEGARQNFTLGLRDAANMVGQLLVRDNQRGFQEGPQSGRHYPNLPRQSSAAGEYPAVQSGQLLGSIGYEVQGAHELHYGSRGAFNRGYDYAVGLHEGNSKIAPRPYLTLTVNRNSSQITNTLGSVTFRRIVGGA